MNIREEIRKVLREDHWEEVLNASGASHDYEWTEEHLGDVAFGSSHQYINWGLVRIGNDWFIKRNGVLGLIAPHNMEVVVRAFLRSLREISQEDDVRSLIQEIIRKVGSEYVLYSHKKNPKTGKRRKLGHGTKEEMIKREKQVNYFKNRG